MCMQVILSSIRVHVQARHDNAMHVTTQCLHVRHNPHTMYTCTSYPLYITFTLRHKYHIHVIKTCQLYGIHGSDGLSMGKTVTYFWFNMNTSLSFNAVFIDTMYIVCSHKIRGYSPSCTMWSLRGFISYLKY